jgi:hypothetical protein
MSTIDITTLAVSKILTSADSSELHSDVSLNNGDVYTSDLRDPKQGLAFNNVKYYGSRTEFSTDGDYILVRTDGDPYPAKAGASAGYLFSTPTNDIDIVRSWIDDPNPLAEQAVVFKFTYRGGTNTDSSSILYTDGGANGIFTNGATYLSPMGGSTLPNESNMTTSDGFYVDAYYFINFLGKDLAGHPEEGGEYHYHIGTFLYNMWNNSTFYNSNSYYGDTYYTIPSGTPSPYYNKVIYSDLSGTTGNSKTDHMRHTDGHSKIVGFCFDGYPIYGPFGYTNSDSASGGLKLMTSNYSLKTTAPSGRPYTYTSYYSLAPYISVHESDPHSYYNDINDLSRNRISMAPGAYVNDWEYKASNGGTLDVYNGKYTKTPDYPNGTYAYFMTMNSSGVPQYPYIVGNYSKQKRTFTESTSQYCTITSNKSSLSAGDTARITFALNKTSTTFTSSDISVSGGTISNFAGGSKNYTADFTPTANSTTDGSIYVASDAFTDADGNKNYISNTLSLSINTSYRYVACTIISSRTTFTPNQTSTITFTMTPASNKLTISLISVVGGSLSNLAAQNNGATYTATFTPSANELITGSIDVSGISSDSTTSFSSTPLSNLNIDTRVYTITPTISSSKTTTFYAGQTSTITFTMSPPTTRFNNSLIDVSGGSLTQVETDDGGSIYTATFTPNALTTTTGYITVSGTSSDATTTFTTSSLSLSINTNVSDVTCTISSDKTTFTAGDTATITFSMSPATTKFEDSMILISGGSLGSRTMYDNGATYTATFTPYVNTYNPTGYISVDGTSDDASTMISSNTLSLDVDTRYTDVTCTISSTNTVFGIDDTSVITFAMNPSSMVFDNSLIDVSGGTLTTVVTDDDGATYTATFTPNTFSLSSGTNFRTANSALYNYDGTVLYSFYDYTSTSFTIPDNVTTIGKESFISTAITSIVIPKSVTTISESAFSNCINLTSITFEGDYPSIQTNSFSGINSGATFYYDANTSGWYGITAINGYPLEEI